MIKINKYKNEEKTIMLKEVVATIKNSKEIHDFQVEIQKGMERTEEFAVDSIEFIEKILTSKDSVIMLYYDNETLVGLFELNIPDDKTNLEHYNLSKYKTNIDLNKVAICECTVVHKNYRGNGLQCLFIKKCEELARNMGYKYIVGTVHPENSYSCSNFKKCGYQFLEKTNMDYGLRYILFKEI